MLAIPGSDALGHSLAQRSASADTILSPHYETPATRFLRASMGEEMGPHAAHPATPGVITAPTIGPKAGGVRIQGARFKTAVEGPRFSGTSLLTEKARLSLYDSSPYHPPQFKFSGHATQTGSFDDPQALKDSSAYVYLPTPLVAAEAAGFPGEVIDEVIVPVPSEIFMVMDKLGKPDWKSELRNAKTPTFSNRIDVALLLGNVVAEGFVAVQAEDRASVERIGKDVLKLAESLGLKDTVLPHTNSILEASKNSHWEIVRVELDKTQKTVRDTMEERRDAELAQCVSLGGWLRGTEAVTDLITKNYTSDAAELLNQPDIIQHFQKELKKLARKNSKLKDMLEGLTTISGIIGAGDEPPSADGVKTINTTTAKLVKSITSNASVAQ